MKVEYFNSERVLNPDRIASVAEFLYKELGKFGDPSSAISKAIQYAMDPSDGKGGLVAVMSDSGQIIGAAVVNRTGMEEYIPENILVYVAVHHDHRSLGLGKYLLSAMFKQVKGDIALHVDSDNPAISLYQYLGFEKKYIEMRLLRKEQQWLA